MTQATLKKFKTFIHFFQASKKADKRYSNSCTPMERNVTSALQARYNSRLISRLFNVQSKLSDVC
ncbi:hypothetical protein KPSA1_03574 [Pseudomonas syringae pv. actinidiae]|uniref:Uncharacterized protein n=1 Tax=Pseudomonas syringae pv. actinidiae TaxID=103796 RepID=A0A2V0QLR6_PSESF|nr:hypothetical protein KPSA1_03574 [Pseudomonas syringae pv. actinidiae]